MTFFYIVFLNFCLLIVTILPNLAAKDKYKFSIEEDANVIYKENFTLVSLTKIVVNVTSNSDSVHRIRSV